MIQIDMPMPKNCLDCPACNEYLMCAIPVNGRGWGENDVKDFSQSRPEWCPMKEQEAELPYRCAKTITHAATKLDDATCPSCGNVIRVRYDYCHYCGQKLDWEGR